MMPDHLRPSSPYRIDVLGDVLRLEVQGVASRPHGLDAVATAVAEARKNGCSCILFDIRKANRPDFHAAVIERAEGAAASGITKFRVALVGTPGSPLLAFIEDVAVNRGLQARCFTDEALAMRWLLSGP
jgi:hypothetical protein